MQSVSQGDIVYAIGGGAEGLVAAGEAGSKSLRQMERDTKNLQKEIDRLGKVAVDFQRSLNSAIGVTDKMGKSAKESAAAFQQFYKAKDQVDALRASIDPLFAATKRYEAALQTLDTALAEGAISQAHHASMMDMAAAAYLRPGAAMDQVGKKSIASSQGLRMFSMQMSQVGQQTMATGNFVQALSMQLPDMALGFGAVGAAAGLLAGIALPILVSAFTDTGEAAKEAAAQVERLQAAQQSVVDSAQETQTEIDKLRFGVDEGYQVELLREQLRLRDEYNAKVAALNAYLATTTDSIDRQRVMTAGLRDEIIDIVGRYDAISASLRTQQDRSTQLAIIEGQRAQRAAEAKAETERAAAAADLLRRNMVNAYGVYASTRAEAARLADQTERAARALATYKAGGLAAQYSMYGEGRVAGEQAYREAGALYGGTGNVLPDSYYDTGGGGGGGGGGAAKFESELKALQDSLLTKEQIELEAYARQQEMLQTALEQKRVTLEEYQRLTEKMQADHQAKMAEIDVWSYGTGLQKAEAFFSDMADATQAGHGVLGQIHKAAAVAEALVSAKASTIAAWEKGMKAGGPPLAAAYAALSIAKTASMISGLTGSSGGGRGASASSASAPAAPSVPTTVNVRWVGEMTGASLGSLTRQLNAELKQGYRLNIVTGGP